MVNRQLTNLVKQSLLEGVSEEDVNNYFLAKGWKQEDLNEAFNEAYLVLDGQAAQGTRRGEPFAISFDAIVQLWLTVVLVFLGYYKNLVIFPTFLEIAIRNEILTQLIDLLFKPAGFLTESVNSYFLHSSLRSGTIYFNSGNNFSSLYSFIFYALESFMLAFLILALFKSSWAKEFFVKTYFILKGKASMAVGKGQSQPDPEKYKRDKYYFLQLAAIAALSLVFGAYLLWPGVISPMLNSWNNAVDLKRAITNNLPFRSNDDKRVDDLLDLGALLEKYYQSNNQYPVANEIEKISDEDGSVFRELKKSGFIEKPYQDPLGEKYYYGYKSDGYSYELSAVFENEKDSRCAKEAKLCVYTLKKNAPKCEFDKVTIYTNKRFENVNISKRLKKIAGLNKEFIAHYSGTSDFQQHEADFSVFEFDTGNNAEKYLEMMEKSTDCEMGSVKGRCVLWFKGQINNAWISAMARGGLFGWREYKTVKTIFVLESGKTRDEYLLKDKAKDSINIFVSTFRSCRNE